MHDARHLSIDVSKMLISGVGIGGLSPLLTGEELGLNNCVFVAFGMGAAALFAYCANRLMKLQKK